MRSGPVRSLSIRLSVQAVASGAGRTRPDPAGLGVAIVFGTKFAPDIGMIFAHAFMRTRRLPGWQGGKDGQTTSTRFAAK